MPQSPVETHLLTRGQLAHRWGKSPETLRRWQKEDEAQGYTLRVPSEVNGTTYHIQQVELWEAMSFADPPLTREEAETIWIGERAAMRGAKPKARRPRRRKEKQRA